MTLVAWSLRLAALAALASLLASALAHVWRPARGPARRLPLPAALAVAASLAVLSIAFLRADLSVFYVWANTDTAYPWWLRIAGVWGGQAGTFLLWSTAILAACAVQNRRDEGEAWRRARTVLLLLATVLLAAPLALDLGASTSLYGLTADSGFQLGASGPSPTSVRPAGDGLNPLLESVYMSIHPVVEFLAYGLAAVPFAYGLVGLFAGARVRDRILPWARAAWAAFLVALTLGSLWAYHVLSFGGYWIWDPVEVGNLLPFLALTVYLHAEPVNRRGWLELLAPASAVLAFVLVLFASFVTRTGLWSSVHAFLPTGLSIAIQDPTVRLVRAVEAGFQPAFATRLFAGGLGAACSAFAAFHARGSSDRTRGAWGLAAGLYALAGLAGLLAPAATASLVGAAARGLALGNPLAGIALAVAVAGAPLLYGLARSPPETPVSPRNRGGQLTLAAAVLALLALATGLLLVLGVNGYGEDVFWTRAPFLAAPVLALVGVTFAPWSWSTRVLAVTGGLLAGALARVVSGSWTWAALPVVGVVLAGLACLYLRRAQPRGSRARRARAGLLGLSGVLGLVHWASPGVVSIAGLTLASPAVYVPVGLLAALGAVLSPWLEKRTGWGWIGPALGVLAVGYGLGALAALAAALLPRGTGRRVPLRTVGLPLLHAGLVILVLGVALSTYGATGTSFDEGDPLVRGEPAQLGDHAIELVDGDVVDADGDGRPETVAATVHVTRDGDFLAEERVSLSYDPSTGLTGQGSFVPDGSPAVRGWWGDVALNADTATPLSIRLDEPGRNATWIAANGPMPRNASGEVQAVSMGVQRLPGVNLVWAGVPLVLVGFAARVLPRS